MTDIADELKQIKSILNVLYSKLERLEGQVAYCVDALMDDMDADPWSQHDIEEFNANDDDDNDDDDNGPQPQTVKFAQTSSSSSTTNIV